MQNIKAVSLAVFAASFLIGFTVFQANRMDAPSQPEELQLSMTLLYSSQ